MELLKNEKGLTLLEVLISIVLLSMVLLTTMSFFPQMGLVNKQNEEKTQAINSAKEVLINWQESTVVKTYLASDNQTAGFTPAYVDEKVNYTFFSSTKYTGYYYFETTKNNYNAQIKIKKSPNKSSSISYVHQIIVQLINKRGNVVAETFGYVTR
ncbi:prepilin-type N-terminal cleavage/methylation domain-containing protein [Neobacillus sp. GCM10023253]|uniref:prepilin-type N-terminal cleavage/methylation domain-containing protein n=1 Tax=Neobacillus sp. GCM10023253 TaxID=3252644 RepID=UPI0036195F81